MKCECSLDSSLCTEGSRQSKVIISPTVHTKRYTKSLTNKNSLDSSDLESQVFLTDPENQSVFVNKTKTGCFAKRKIFCSAIIIVLDNPVASPVISHPIIVLLFPVVIP